MPRRSRPWLTAEQLARWRAQLEKRDPVEALVRLIWSTLAQDILPAFRFGDDAVDMPAVAGLLAYPLGDAVVARLEDDYPDRAARGPAALIRAKKVATLKRVGHASAWTTDRLHEDLIASPVAPLESRVRRLVAAGIELPRLPGGRRPAWLGLHYTLEVVVIHDRFVHGLPTLFTLPWPQVSFEDRFTVLQRETDREFPDPRTSPFSEDVLTDAANYDSLREATYVLTAAVMGLAETTVPRLVRQARPLAVALDEADRAAGRA
jgi:hypothetical protein